jgi:TatD DNase family protein
MQAHRAQEIGGVVHCFSYSLELAREYVKMGFFIGISGVVTFKNARKLKEVAAGIPIESIVLETDCPYLAPVPYRGKRNSSLYLPYVAEEIARLKGMDTEKVIEITEKNAERLYRLA